MKIDGNKVVLKNNIELIELEYKKVDKKIIIPILNYDAAFELEQIGNTLRGYWVKYNRKNEYKLSVFGMKTKLKKFPKIDKVAFDTDINWKIIFENNSYGILIHKGNNTYSSIVTETGDYRYLSSKHEGESLVLYGFDGIFAFYLIAGYQSDYVYEGKMFAGLSYNQKFVTKNDPNLKLRDPNKITTYQGDLSKIKLQNLKGEKKILLKKARQRLSKLWDRGVRTVLMRLNIFSSGERPIRKKILILRL